MTTFTSSLPDNLLNRLADFAKKNHVAKNRIIEKALTIYLNQLNRAEYASSYQQTGQDVEIMQMAEEGRANYLSDLKNTKL